MKTPHRCNGWAYQLCTLPAIGTVYQGYADRSWDAQYICLSHFLEIVATLDSRVLTPTHVELHATDSIGPSWTRTDGR
jgi:hypothetical protein